MSAIAEDVLRTGSLAAAEDVVELSQPGTATVMVQLTGTFTATVVFEVNVDQGSSPAWVATNVTNVNTGASASSATAAGIYRVDVSGCREFRVRCSAFTSGPVVVTMNGSVATARPPLGSSGAIVDTELPAAVSLVTGTAAQTAPFVGAAMFGQSAANTWNSILTASNLADGATGGQSLPAFNWVWNGTTWDRLKGTTNNVGYARVAPALTMGAIDGQSNTLSGILEESGAGRPVGAALYVSNGTTFDRFRGNVEAILLASAARTTTQGAATDIVTYNVKGIHVILDMTVVGTGSVTVTIDGKDPASGKYYNLLTGAAVTTNSTNVYRIYPGIVVAANAAANDHLPRTIRIVVTANNANPATYSVGYCLLT